MSAMQGAQDFLRANHLAPLLTNDQPALQTLNKWTTAGTALQVRMHAFQAAVYWLLYCDRACMRPGSCQTSAPPPALR